MQLDEHRKQVVEALRAELKKDKLKTSVVSMTNLGLVELTRKRTRLPADSFLLEPCKGCMGGYVVSSAHIALRLRDEMIEFSLKNEFGSMLVRLNPEICEKVFSSHVMSREAAGLWKGKRIYLIPDENVGRETFEISGSSDKILTLPANARLLF